MVGCEFKLLRVWPDHCCSGIWEPPGPCSQQVGPMIGYDLLGLPPKLVARFQAWQDKFDANVSPPDSPPEEWWEEFEREQVELAKALQSVVGAHTRVQYEFGGVVWTVGRDKPDADFRKSAD